MEKVLAYGSAEEADLKQEQITGANARLKMAPEKEDGEKDGPEKLFSRTKKLKLEVTEIPLSIGKLKIGIKIEEPLKDKPTEGADKGKQAVSLKLGKVQRNFFKNTAEATLAKAGAEVIEFCPDLKLKLGLDFFKVDSKGNFNMLKAYIAMPVKVLSKNQVENTPLSGFAASMSDKAKLYVEIRIETDLAPKEVLTLKQLQVKQAEVNTISDEVTQLDNKVKRLSERKLKSKTGFFDEKLKELGKKSRDELSPKEIKKLERQFNKACEELRDEIIDTKNKLRGKQKHLKQLEQKAVELSKKIKSPLIKKLNTAFLKKIGALLAKLAKALNYTEMVYSALKILILLWSGAKIRLLNGLSLSDIGLNEMSELLMQVMLDKITGKKQAETPDEYTNNPEEAGAGSGTGKDSISEIQTELQNFINLHGKTFMTTSGTKTGDTPGSVNGTGSGDEPESSESPNTVGLGKTSEGTAKETGEQVKKEGVKAVGDGEKTEAVVLKENGEKMVVMKVRITDINLNQDFQGESRVIGNKRIKLNKESVTHGEEVEFSFTFTTYLKGELCEFRIPVISARIYIDKLQKGKPQKITLIVTKSITCYFEGGKLCIKKGETINYTQIQK